jgi:tetratricopeptide (TPR) repeat protein
VLVGAVLAVVAAGVYFGTDLFRGASSAPTDDAAVATVPDGSAGTDEDGGKSTAELLQEADRLAAQVTGAAPTRDVAERAAEVLARAHASMDRGAWEQAVLEFNEVLELDPTNGEAAAGLLDAGQRYRERKAQDAEYERAVRAFESGDYASALRVLYRLPADLRADDVRRLKVEGWYNLGVVELRAGNLSEARGHFGEVTALDDGDRAAAEAAALIDRYAGRPLDGAYYATVGRLEFRGPGS